MCSCCRRYRDLGDTGGTSVSYSTFAVPAWSAAAASSPTGPCPTQRWGCAASGQENAQTNPAAARSGSRPPLVCPGASSPQPMLPPKQGRRRPAASPCCCPTRSYPHRLPVGEAAPAEVGAHGEGVEGAGADGECSSMMRMARCSHPATPGRRQHQQATTSGCCPSPRRTTHTSAASRVCAFRPLQLRRTARMTEGEGGPVRVLAGVVAASSGVEAVLPLVARRAVAVSVVAMLAAVSWGHTVT